MSAPTGAPPTGRMTPATSWGQRQSGPARWHWVNPRGLANNQFYLRAIGGIIFLGLGAVVLSLLTTGDPNDVKVGYPLRMGWGIFAVVMTAGIIGPLIDMAVSKHKRSGGIIGKSIAMTGGLALATALLSFLGVFINPAFGKNLWMLLGPIPAGIAFLFSYWLVWRIWALGDQDPQIQHHVDDVARLEATLAAQKGDETRREDEKNIADNQAAGAKTLMEQKKTANKDAKKLLDEAKKRYEAIPEYEAVKTASKAVSNAKLKFDAAEHAANTFKAKNSSLKKTLSLNYATLLLNQEKAKKKLKVLQGATPQNPTKIATAQTKVAAATAAVQAFENAHPGMNQKLAATYGKLLIELRDTKAAWTSAKRKLKKATKVAEATVLGSEFVIATTAATTASDEFSAAQTGLAGAEAAQATAKSAYEIAHAAVVKTAGENGDGGDLAAARNGRDRLLTQAQRKTTRWWTISVVLLVVSVVLYSGLNGFVMSTFV